MDHLTNCINQVNEKVYNVAQSYDHTMENLDLTIQEHLLHGLGSKGFSKEWLQAVNKRLDFLRNGLMATEKARFLLDTRRSSELQRLSSNLESISKRIDILMIKNDSTSHIIDLDPEDFKDVLHNIDTGDNPPIKSMPIRRSQAGDTEVNQEINKLLEAGLIKPSKSPWFSPILIVKNKDGTDWVVIDLQTSQ